HAAVRGGVAEDRWNRTGGTGTAGAGRRCGAAHRAGGTVRGDGTAGSVYLQYRDRRADGAHSRGAGLRAGYIALSVRDDGGAGRLGRLHDARIIAGEYTGGRSGRLQLSRFRAGRRAADAAYRRSQHRAGAVVAAVLKAAADHGAFSGLQFLMMTRPSSRSPRAYSRNSQVLLAGS